MSDRLRAQDGASLILALVFTTIVAVAALAIAQFAFSGQKAAVIYGDKAKLVSALDAGLQAAIEEARVRTPFGCASPTLTLPTPINGQLVAVDCTTDGATPATDTAAQLRFTAEPAAACPAERLTALQADVALSTIDGTADGARIARVRSWKTIPPTPC